MKGSSAERFFTTDVAIELQILLLVPMKITTFFTILHQYLILMAGNAGQRPPKPVLKNNRYVCTPLEFTCTLYM